MQYWGLTDPGCVRSQNQDTFMTEQLDRNTLLCVVCDGMGGAKSGNVASSLAAEVFVEEVRRTWNPGMDQEKIDRMLEAAVKLANFTVFDQAQQFEEFRGMGTTLVATLIQGKSVVEALAIVDLSPRKAAALIGKTLRSAVSNAENNMDVNRKVLTVKAALVSPGPIIRRFRAKARGSAGRIRKRTSHFEVILTDN